MSETSTEHALRALQESGNRVTVQTRAVISVIAETDRHLTAEDVLVAVERRIPGVAESTVYRVIQRLSELGVVSRTQTGLGPAVYHLHSVPHAHLVCDECHSIIDVPAPDLEPLTVGLQQSYDFTVDPLHWTIAGRCGDCTRRAGRATRSDRAPRVVS